MELEALLGENIPKEMSFSPEYFSIKDKLKTVWENPEGKKLVVELLALVGVTPSKQKIKMAYHFSIEKIIDMAGEKAPSGSKELVNARLQQIKKKK